LGVLHFDEDNNIVGGSQYNNTVEGFVLVYAGVVGSLAARLWMRI
jgi:hypothetical protein